MTQSVDYSFYSGEWRGSLKEEDFLSEVSRATSFVDCLIGYNEVRTEEQRVAYKKAVCASIDAFSSYGYDEGGSFRVGDFTSPAGAKSGKQIAAENARQLLFASGLLWGGIR